MEGFAKIAVGAFLAIGFIAASFVVLAMVVAAINDPSGIYNTICGLWSRSPKILLVLIGVIALPIIYPICLVAYICRKQDHKKEGE